MAESITIRSPESTGPSLEEEAAAMDAKAAEVKDSGGLPSDGADSGKILGKFDSHDDLIKAYVELEKKLGSKASEPKDSPKELADPTDSQAEKAVESAGLNMNDLSAEYAEKGELSEASYKKLEKVGFPKEVVDEYIAGKQALAQLAENAVYESVGGKDNYGSMLEWAADNLSSDEIDVYNEAVNSGNRVKTLMAVKGLKAQYDTQSGSKEPDRVVSGKGKSGQSTYRSVAELTRDMGDKRYYSDPAYRKDVEEKLARSNIF